MWALKFSEGVSGAPIGWRVLRRKHQCTNKKLRISKNYHVCAAYRFFGNTWHERMQGVSFCCSNHRAGSWIALGGRNPSNWIFPCWPPGYRKTGFLQWPHQGPRVNHAAGLFRDEESRSCCRMTVWLRMLMKVESKETLLQISAPGSSKWPNLIPQWVLKEVHDHSSKAHYKWWLILKLPLLRSHCWTSSQNKSEQEQ